MNAMAADTINLRTLRTSAPSRVYKWSTLLHYEQHTYDHLNTITTKRKITKTKEDHQTKTTEDPQIVMSRLFAVFDWDVTHGNESSRMFCFSNDCLFFWNITHGLLGSLKYNWKHQIHPICFLKRVVERVYLYFCWLRPFLQVSIQIFEPILSF